MGRSLSEPVRAIGAGPMSASAASADSHARTHASSSRRGQMHLGTREGLVKMRREAIGRPCSVARDRLEKGVDLVL